GFGSFRARLLDGRRNRYRRLFRRLAPGALQSTKELELDFSMPDPRLDQTLPQLALVHRPPTSSNRFARFPARSTRLSHDSSIRVSSDECPLRRTASISRVASSMERSISSISCANRSYRSWVGSGRARSASRLQTVLNRRSRDH